MSSREITFAAAGAGAPPNYIEDVFSTWLYTGTDSAFYINNGLNVNAKGGLELIKGRSQSASGNPSGAAGRWFAFSKESGTSDEMSFYGGATSTTGAGTSTTAPLWFTSSGQLIDGSGLNTSGQTYVSWTFQKQAKFFDVTTATQTTGNTGWLTFNHSLGSVPGMIIIKVTSTTDNWFVYHRSTSSSTLFLNLTNAAAATVVCQNVTSTSFEFNLSNYGSGNGATYVAYVFAHNAGGFGLTGTDNVISCGTFTGNTTVNLGYEPQWILLKNSGSAENWYIHDNMRGWPVSGDARVLYPNLGNAESGTSQIYPNATGFSTLIGGGTYIYMAIRRGPMKTPTSGTTVFQPVRYAGNNTNGRVISTGKTFPTDWLLTFDTENGASGSGTSYNSPDITRLAGFGVNPPYLRTNSTAAESASVVTITLNNSNFDYTVSGSSGQLNATGANYTNWNIGRAPGFFDVVCYTGTAYPQPLVNHNLGVAPELMIVKRRNGTSGWAVYSKLSGSSDYVYWSSTGLNGNTAATGNIGASPYITSTTIDFDAIAVSPFTGTAGATNVVYLFATVAGVSKVGSYTGTGSTQTINAGLPTGARFVLIKRTDSTGDWWAWDTATGMVAGNDTRIAINQTGTIINTNWVYTATNGFQIVTTDASVNANGGSYIYLAIA